MIGNCTIFIAYIYAQSIVDVMMPDIDGFALINMFKQALKKDIPTISA